MPNRAKKDANFDSASNDPLMFEKLQELTEIGPVNQHSHLGQNSTGSNSTTPGSIRVRTEILGVGSNWSTFFHKKTGGGHNPYRWQPKNRFFWLVTL